MSKDYDAHNYLQSRAKYLVRNGNSFEVLPQSKTRPHCIFTIINHQRMSTF